MSNGPVYLAFPMADVFPPDDPLSEWLVTLALAMNDLALVHIRFEADQDEPDRMLYWNRVAISHYTEASLFLETADVIPEVRDFVDSLDDEPRAAYDATRAVFQELRGELFRTRNKATFHYPELRPADPQAERLVRDALVQLSAYRGVIRAGRIREARALFADDVVATIFIEQVGGAEAFAAFTGRVAEGTTSFIRFANLSLDEHLIRAGARDVTVEEVEPVDPGDLRMGWRSLQQ